MRIQSLAVIFIIIVLPISMVLTAYTKNQMQTVELQILYDSRLKNATYDAIKAFQLNTVNSSTSDLANSKIRDIEASANTFFNSVSKRFNLEGYNSEILKEYVPALVYTMYDGYYIYSPFTNQLDTKNKNQVIGNDGNTTNKSDAELLDKDSEYNYKNEQKVFGLKPYIHYSCRYNRGNDDFVITYSMDNYITIEGTINNKPVYDSGYLLTNVTYTGNINNPATIKYKGVDIEKESLLEEQIGDGKLYKYIKINGVKYYYDKDNGTWFSILNGERYNQDRLERLEGNDAKCDTAMRYYIEGLNFTTRCRNEYNLGELNKENIADKENKENFAIRENDKIFDFDNSNGIESPNSNFNQHRLSVIRTAIEKNLSIAIANYNNYSEVTTNFQMPKLKEDEWEKILNNVSLISFLQGLNIGGKIYNGYAIITNNKTEEVVSEDSIYIVGNTGNYHRVNDNELLNGSVIPTIGILNVDFEIKSKVTENGTRYFYPRSELASYSSIVTQNSVNKMNNVYEYFKGVDTNTQKMALAKIYYTALGRERYGMYRTANNADEMKANYK